MVPIPWQQIQIIPVNMVSIPWQQIQINTSDKTPGKQTTFCCHGNHDVTTLKSPCSYAIKLQFQKTMEK